MIYNRLDLRWWHLPIISKRHHIVPYRIKCKNTLMHVKQLSQSGFRHKNKFQTRLVDTLWVVLMAHTTESLFIHTLLAFPIWSMNHHWKCCIRFYVRQRQSCYMLSNRVCVCIDASFGPNEADNWIDQDRKDAIICGLVSSFPQSVSNTIFMVRRTCWIG